MASPLQKKEVSMSRIDAVEGEFIWVIVTIQPDHLGENRP
jgi:hypothetical protein